MKNQVTKEPFFQLLLIALGAAIISTMVGYALSLVEQNEMIEAGMLPEYLELKQSKPIFYAVVGYGTQLYSRGDALFVVGSILTLASLAFIASFIAIYAWKYRTNIGALNR